MSEHQVNTDIAIVGAGGCGLVAALTAAHAGKRVLLLERAQEAGGSTAMSAGIIVAAGSRLQKAKGELGTAKELAFDIFSMNGQKSDYQVTLSLCRASGALVDWMIDLGVPLEHMSGYRYLGMSRFWLHSPPERTGTEITGRLQALVDRHPAVDLRLRTAVAGLSSAGGVVNGLRAVASDGEPVNVLARSVILAASGYGANAAMVETHAPELAGMPYYGAPFADGEAITWGQGLGATVTDMRSYQTHSSIAYPDMMLVTTFLINHGAIQVNQLGHRFGDETDTYSGHALSVQRQPGRSVVEIFDERILRHTLENYPRFNDCMDAGIVKRAGTLEELAHHFELDRANLGATMAQYEQACDAGRDQFGRSTFGEPFSPPYFGIRVTSALVQTLGGLGVDAWARVLGANGRPIRGLYAGGGTAAGFSGGRSQGYMAGTGLLAAFGLGWIAGRHASQS